MFFWLYYTYSIRNPEGNYWKKRTRVEYDRYVLVFKCINEQQAVTRPLKKNNNNKKIYPKHIKSRVVCMHANFQKSKIFFYYFTCAIIWYLIYIVPGDPQEVKAAPINSTTIKVTWKPPLAKDRNGIIRGYHIHVQETKEEVKYFQCF